MHMSPKRPRPGRTSGPCLIITIINEVNNNYNDNNNLIITIIIITCLRSEVIRRWG